ncbi:MAG: hypothetical protein RSD57_00035 [Comamonas sp.]
MSLYRIIVCFGGRNNLSFPGLFVSTKEAQDQTWADFPDARGVSVFFIKGANNA